MRMYVELLVSYILYWGALTALAIFLLLKRRKAKP